LTIDYINVIKSLKFWKRISACINNINFIYGNNSCRNSNHFEN